MNFRGLWFFFPPSFSILMFILVLLITIFRQQHFSTGSQHLLVNQLCSHVAPWVGARYSPKLLCHSSSGQRRGNIMKSSWVKRRTERDHSTITVMGKTDSSWGNQFNWLPIKSEYNNEKSTPVLKTPFCHHSILPGFNFTPSFLFLLPLSSSQGQGMGVHYMLFVLLLPPQGGDSTCSSSAPV